MINSTDMFTNLEMALHIAQVYAPLDVEELHRLANILVCYKYKRGEIVLNEGDVCDSLLVVERGLLRQYYYKQERDLTEHISYEDGIIICIESYFKSEPSRIIIEAIEPAIVWALPKEKIESASLEFPQIGRLYRKFLEWSLIESQVKADTLRFESASARYLKLMEHHPEVVKRAPLVYIASLLQMTPETLSRVRAQNTKP